MKLRVRDVLKLELFKQCKIVAGEKGINNEILFVDVLEVPDAHSKWIKKNIFLITTAYAIKDNEELQRDIVKYLAESGVAALGIKIGRFIDEIPESVIKIADEYGFPIIQMPPSIAYIDIINTLLGIILDRQSQIIKKVDVLHQELNKLILSSKGEKAIIETVGKQINLPVLLLDLKFGELEKYGDDRAITAFEDDIRHNLLPEEINTVLLSRTTDDMPFLISPIMIEKVRYGYVAFLNINEEEDFLHTFIERTSTTLAMEFMKGKIEKETEIRIKGDMIYDVLLGNVADESIIQGSINYIGWKADEKYAVAVLNINGKKADNISSTYSNLINRINISIKRDNSKSVVINKLEKFIIILECTKYRSRADEKKHTLQICKRIIADIMPWLKKNEISCGIGRAVDDITKLNISYDEALKSLKFAGMEKEANAVVHYDDMGVYRVLMDSIDKDETVRFYKEYMGPVIKYDKEYNAELITTLNAYFESNFNSLLTSKKLFIHRNTLNYRLKKIEDLLDIDLTEYKNRLSLQLAVAISNIVNCD